MAGQIEPIGSLTGSGATYAQRIEDKAKLVFLVEEHEPARGTVYSVEEDLAYVVEAIEPREGLTVSARASRLSKVKARTYNAPLV